VVDVTETVLSIAAVVLLAVFLRRRSGRDRGLSQSEMARHGRVAEKERQDWIYPFET
jgi:hypothetical protein